ncbi:hypothetical protein QBC40DRAFT_317742 [Triangularia verruculosa]|uniref:AAA+ ATPase domain-containing protein n=1 Tax=Triangularia verruculosa TaxID=2587418 RepID=A0AAN7ARF8_9PEZI|nr:hypothetical protein QBC40DRAFT_317742 [Triangularia verruculosa]
MSDNSSNRNEQRVQLLEARRLRPKANPKPCHTGPIQVNAHFFELWQQRIADPEFFNPHRKKQQQAGFYTSENDRQQLIRVLYQRSIGYQQEPDFSVAPDVEDIDILEFGVLSNHIVDFFTSMLEMNINENGINKGNGRYLRFSKPFKPVIQQRDKLHSHLRKLELDYAYEPQERCGDTGLSSETCSEESVTTASRQRPLLSQSPELPEAIQHFRVFIWFVDTYFGDKFRLYNELRQHRKHSVAFEDLWMLFEAGDDIYCPSRQPELSGPVTDNNGTSDPFAALGPPMPGWGPNEPTPRAARKSHTPIARYTPQAYHVIVAIGGSVRRDGWTNPRLGDSLPSQRRNPGLNEAKPNVRSMAPLAVHCYYLDFNGRDYGPVHDVFVFRPYEGEIDICSLEAYPLTPTQKSELENRGLGFIESTSVSHMQYQGYTVGLHKEEIDTPVIVDMRIAFIETSQDLEKSVLQVPKFISAGEISNIFDSFADHNPELETAGVAHCGFRCCYIHVTEHSRSTRMTWLTFDADIKILLDDHGRHGSVAETQRSFVTKHLKPRLLHLLPGTVPGYALRSRKWALLELTRLQPVEHNYGWKDLVLPEGHRRMVQAMVETHATQQADRHQALGMDLVPGKADTSVGLGKGCIILLHGAPGVGKTSTAECVAAHTGKPLYPITCGDIGYQPYDVERNMQHHFRLAHKWGCVLLLDEADSNQQRDVERNGLVSVFLRILEYYSGILFLTTNRVGAIDDAFRSRIHLTLYYRRLGRDQTITIFKRNFKRVGEINKDREKHNLPPFEYKDQQRKILMWAKKEWKTLRWNGRQIRNAFQTVMVMALAEYKARRKQASEGDQKTPDTQGLDEETKAKREQIRSDAYEGIVEKKHYEATSDESDTDDSEELENQTGSVTEDEDDEEDADSECKRKGKIKGGKQRKTAKKDKETRDKKKDGKKGASGKKKKGKKTDSDDEDEETEEDDD